MWLSVMKQGRHMHHRPQGLAIRREFKGNERSSLVCALLFIASPLRSLFIHQAITLEPIHIVLLHTSSFTSFDFNLPASRPPLPLSMPPITAPTTSVPLLGPPPKRSLLRLPSLTFPFSYSVAFLSTLPHFLSFHGGKQGDIVFFLVFLRLSLARFLLICIEDHEAAAGARAGAAAGAAAAAAAAARVSLRRSHLLPALFLPVLFAFDA